MPDVQPAACLRQTRGWPGTYRLDPKPRRPHSIQTGWSRGQHCGEHTVQLINVGDTLKEKKVLLKQMEFQTCEHM